MSETPSRKTVANQILAGLSVQDFGLLAPHLEAVDLPLCKMLERRQRKLAKSGFASVVANGSAGKPLRSA